MTDGLSYTPAELERMGYKVQSGVCVPLDFRGADMLLMTDAVARSVASKYGLAPNGRAYKSKWEAAYAAELDLAQRAGAMTWWRYEEVTLLIGHDVRYTPDFVIRLPNGAYVVREVKGFWRGDAKTKFRVAAMAHSWLRFEAITKAKGQWHTLEVWNG